MPPADSSALIVARFLKSNHYNQTYDVFIREVGLPESAGDISKGDLTLETLLEEKKTFDLSLRFEKLGTSDEASGWTEPAPKQEHAITTLPSKSNLLSTSVETFVDNDDNARTVLLASSADRRLHMLDVPSYTLLDSWSHLQDSPILSCAVLQKKVLLTTSMSGQLVASDFRGTKLDSRRDHKKYIVKVEIFHGRNNRNLIATAGWDQKICVYETSHQSVEHAFQIGDPISTITLPTKPEAILFLTHPDTQDPILLISRTDSSHLFYYTISNPPRLLGKQNLAPHSNAWVAFTPSSLALCPTDPTLLAVGTNSVPHMKLLILRLLFPPYEPHARHGSHANGPNHQQETQASQARAALAIAETESQAIQIHANTLAPQTPFSTPAVAWRPDGTGVWVNGDDGGVRGVEVGSGKVVSVLRGHEEGSKVRCLWAGVVGGGAGREGNVGEEGGRKGREDGEEWLVSGGFDQKLIVWRPAASASPSE